MKSPKIYVRDTGLLQQLLGIDSLKALFAHSKMGASWEGFVIAQTLMVEPHEVVFFWATHQGADIDLILRRGGELFGVDCKRTDSPRLTPSIRIALEDLKFKFVIVLYPGVQRFPLANQVEAVPVKTLAEGVSLLDRL